MATSVVIPAHNAGSYIEEAITSLLNQTVKNLEIIIVDDGSTDDTADRVARYPVKYVRQANHGHPGASRNAGLRHCTSEFIAFLDADDRSHPERIAEQERFLKEHPSVGMVFTDYRNFSADKIWPNHFEGCPRIRQALTNKSVTLQSQEALDILLEENYALPSTMMIRREVLTSVPGFTSEVKIGEDIHFAYLVAKRWSVGLLDMIGSERRVHDSNISGDMVRFLSHWLMAQSLLRASEISPMLQDKLDRLSRRTRLSLARELANRRQFRASIAHGLQARGLASLKVIARTLAIAAGLRSL